MLKESIGMYLLDHKDMNRERMVRMKIATMAGLTGISGGYQIVDMHAKTNAHRHTPTTKETMCNHQKSKQSPTITPH